MLSAVERLRGLARSVMVTIGTGYCAARSYGLLTAACTIRILKGSFSIRSDTLAPATLSRGRFLSDRTRICETILMTPRAAADRPRAPGYMVWMRTIDI